jgi:hypothetical protein
MSGGSAVHHPADALDRYLRDHWTAATAEVDLARRAARGQSGQRVREELASVADEAAEDRAALLAIMVDLGVERSPARERLAGLAERIGRLKPNGSLLRRSRLSDLLELEALSLALQAKELRWLALRHVADEDARLNPYHLDTLLRRAHEQEVRVEELRLEVAADALVSDRTRGDRA